MPQNGAETPLRQKLLHLVVARAPRLAPGEPDLREADPSAPVSWLTGRLRDGRTHSTRDLVEPLQDPDTRARALRALRRLHKRGAVEKVGFERWRVRDDLAASA